MEKPIIWTVSVGLSGVMLIGVLGGEKTLPHIEPKTCPDPVFNLTKSALMGSIPAVNYLG